MRSGLAAGMPCRPNCGNWGIWLVNISTTVEALKSRTPVVGHVPLLSRTASTPKEMVSEIGSSPVYMEWHTAILLRLRKKARSTAVEVLGLFLCCFEHESSPKRVITRRNLTTGMATTHVGQLCLHFWCWNHADVLQAERLKDVFLHVIV